jgi:hypothetical protein
MLDQFLPVVPYLPVQLWQISRSVYSIQIAQVEVARIWLQSMDASVNADSCSALANNTYEVRMFPVNSLTGANVDEQLMRGQDLQRATWCICGLSGVLGMR